MICGWCAEIFTWRKKSAKLSSNCPLIAYLSIPRKKTSLESLTDHVTERNVKNEIISTFLVE